MTGTDDDLTRSGEFLPLEAAAEYGARCAVDKSRAMQAFLAGLDPGQRDRFHEFAHELFHDGQEDGMRRRGLTVDQGAEVLARQAEILALGASTLNDILQDGGYDI